MENVNKQSLFPVMFFCFCLVVLLSATAQAEDLTFSWTANPEPVTGYKLYYKTGSDSNTPYNGTGLMNETGQVVDSPIDIGKVVTYTVTGRNENQTYSFVLTAYNDEGESAYTTPVVVGPLDSTAPTINLIRLN